MARANRQDQTFALLIVDLDHFKPINDTYGHQTGDAVPKEVAKRMTESVRINDAVTRFGGDEFVVVLPETPPDVAAVALRRIASVIGSTEFAVANMTEPVPVYLQVGVASADTDDTAESLIARAKDDVK